MIFFQFNPCGANSDLEIGNTLNCNHPVVMELILDSLRHWVVDYHVDGFRFDLASVLCRGTDGSPLSAPPIIRAIAKDPILSRCKIIVEPWDCGGLYLVRRFPNWDRYWTGKTTDTNIKALRFRQMKNFHLALMISQILMEDEPEKYQSHFVEYIKRGIEPDGIEELYKKVHAAIRADPTQKKSEKEPPKQHKRYNLKKLTYDERKASLIERLNALNAATGAEEEVDAEDYE